MNYRNDLSKKLVIHTDHYCIFFMKPITKHNILGWYLLYLCKYTCFLNHFNRRHGRRFPCDCNRSAVPNLPHTRATCWANRRAWQLAQLGNILFSVHIPVLSRGIKLWEEERYMRLNNEINHVVNRELLLESFCKLLIPDNSMPPSKHPKGTYGGSIVSKSCAFGVHAMVATFSMN
jgi:hypothetical protein